jgi:hypothetical protein
MHKRMAASAMHNGMASASVNKRVATTAPTEGHATMYVASTTTAYVAGVRMSSAPMSSTTVPTTGAGLKG